VLIAGRCGALDCRRSFSRIFGAPPAGILPLQSHNDRFKLRRQSIRLAMRPPRAVAESFSAAISVAIENLVAGLAGDPELGAQRRHLLALEQPGHKTGGARP